MPNISSNGIGNKLSIEMEKEDGLQCTRLIQRWMRQWNSPNLDEHIICEWSSRLRRSLGRAYPTRSLVRLSLVLKEPQFQSLFEEVLCHEVAHIVTFQVHGRGAQSHGTEWKELVRVVGFDPRTSHKLDALPPPNGRKAICYEHVCPVCQSKRLAKRPQSKWRCVACQNSGLNGLLTIHSRPVHGDGVNA